jgi:hypothetical protein
MKILMYQCVLIVQRVALGVRITDVSVTLETYESDLCLSVHRRCR